LILFYNCRLRCMYTLGYGGQVSHVFTALVIFRILTCLLYASLFKIHITRLILWFAISYRRQFQILCM